MTGVWVGGLQCRSKERPKLEPIFAMGSQMETEVGVKVEPEALAESRHGGQDSGSTFGEAKKRSNWRPKFKLGPNEQL